ncbi:hypothetical protein BH11BAC5_BH11BAC5_23870 [soil metagenome]
MANIYLFKQIFISFPQINYYCEMKESLKDVLSKQVVLEDGSIFYYTILPYYLKNALGNIIAVLQEFNLKKKGDESSSFTCKLYKTKDSNWYDFEDTKPTVEKQTVRLLKSAIDSLGNK